MDLDRAEVEPLVAAARQESRRAKLHAAHDAEKTERDQAFAEQRKAEAKRIAEKDLFEVRGGSGHGHRQMKKGKVYRNTRFGIADGEPGYFFVLETEAHYHSRDGMAFGIGAESGYRYQAICRAAREDEIQESLADS